MAEVSVRVSVPIQCFHKMVAHIPECLNFSEWRQIANLKSYVTQFTLCKLLKNSLRNPIQLRSFGFFYFTNCKSQHVHKYLVGSSGPKRSLGYVI